MRNNKKLDKDVLGRAQTFMVRRRKFRAPLPVNPLLLYNAVLGEMQCEALRVLLREGVIGFKLTSAFRVHIDLPAPGRQEVMTYKCVVSLDSPMPYFQIEIDQSNLMYEPLARWAVLWEEAHDQLSMTTNTLHGVHDMCRTPADFLRLWPVMGKFFYPHVKRPAIMNLRMKMLTSRINANEELQMAMRQSEEYLAEALLVPDNDAEKEYAYLD